MQEFVSKDQLPYFLGGEITNENIVQSSGEFFGALVGSDSESASKASNKSETNFLCSDTYYGSKVSVSAKEKERDPPRMKGGEDAIVACMLERERSAMACCEAESRRYEFNSSNSKCSLATGTVLNM